MNLKVSGKYEGDAMKISDLIALEGIIANLKATSKKQALQELSRRAGDIIGVQERSIFDVIMERERLGTTGVGNFIAIPHGKLPQLHGLCGLFARLGRPIDFQSIDEQPVDLIFMLLAPAHAGADHLKALALIARLLRNPKICTKLRGTESAEALFAILTETQESPVS